MKFRTVLLALAAAIALSGCIGTMIGVASDAAIEVGKVPFKVGDAVIDVATGDDEDKGAEKK